MNPEDRRNATRFHYRTSAICQRGVDGLGAVESSQIMNISSTGAQILVRGNYENLEQFYFAVVNSRRETIAETRCVVRWKTPEAPGLTRLGISFDEHLSHEQLGQIR